MQRGLLATEPRSTIRSIKKSRYAFANNGKVSEASIGVTLETANGEYLLDQRISLAPEFIHNHGEGAGDYILLRSNLGIGWDYSVRR